MDDLKKYIHKDMLKPHGETVNFIRKNMCYPVTLSGHKPTVEECAEHAECNPGTLRIASLDGHIVYWPEGTKH